ncbi:MAG: hemolysin family protein [Verrucomicrobiales bacterium]
MTIPSSLPFTADITSALALLPIELTPAETAGRIAIMVVLVLLNALFVAAEFALVKIHGSQLEDAVSEKRKGAALALHVANNGDSYLSACQLGITASSIILGAIGEPFVSAWLIPYLGLLGLEAEAVRALAFGISIVLIVTVHMILGEQIPRVFGIRKTRGTTIFCSYPLRAFYLLVAGPVWLLKRTSDFLLRRVFGMEPVDNSHISHTADELRRLVEETGRAHEVTETEQGIVINALGLSELTVRDILTPRNEVVVLDVHKSFRENLDEALESKHTRFPLVDRHLDKTLGLIHIKDLLPEMQKDSPNLFALKRDLIAVSEKVPLDEMLQLFLSKRAHIALVVDEFGGSVGVVMLDDVLDQVVGEILDEFDDEEETGFQRIAETEFVVEGWLPLHELSDQVDDLDLEDPDVSTVGGYVTSVVGRLPEVGEIARIENYDAEILKADERSVQEIRFTRIDEPENEESGGENGQLVRMKAGDAESGDAESGDAESGDAESGDAESGKSG